MFRKNQVGDIEKMFLHICLRERDRDSYRHLSRDLDTEATPKIYLMTRVTFGVISSPLFAICTFQEHARKCKAAFPEASDQILRNTNADGFTSGKMDLNLLSSLNSTCEDIVANELQHLSNMPK